MPEKSMLIPGDLLIAEYKYIAQTAFQTDEDRARVASFYMITFGSFIAALVTYQLNLGSDEQALVPWGFAGLFLALAIMGLLTVLQLARLRHAWFESLQAMDQIREYYIANFKGLEKAFAWRAGSAPQKFKPGSVGFMLALQVAILGGAALGAAVFFVTLAVSGSDWLLPAFTAGGGFCLGQIELYRSLLKE